MAQDQSKKGARILTPAQGDVEPVNGQIKEARRSKRRFSVKGIE